MCASPSTPITFIFLKEIPAKPGHCMRSMPSDSKSWKRSPCTPTWEWSQSPSGHTMLSSLALALAMNSSEALTSGSRGGPMGMPETKVITAFVCATPKPAQTKARSGYFTHTSLCAEEKKQQYTVPVSYGINWAWSTSQKWEQHNKEMIVLAGRKDITAKTTPSYYMSYTTTVSLLLIPNRSTILDNCFSVFNICSLTTIPDTTYGAFMWNRALGMITSCWHVMVTAGQ